MFELGPTNGRRLWKVRTREIASDERRGCAKREYEAI